MLRSSWITGGGGTTADDGTLADLAASGRKSHLPAILPPHDWRIKNVSKGIAKAMFVPRSA